MKFIAALEKFSLMKIALNIFTVYFIEARNLALCS